MNKKKYIWIQSPFSDLTFYDFGWLAVLFPLVLLQQNMALIILIVLLFNYLHRHYTFALVYGEHEEFERQKKIYILLPLAAILVTALFVFFDSFNILLAISVLWTMYHTIAQKYGITRIYSRKAGYGEAWIDQWVIYSWFILIFLYQLVKEQATLARYTAGRVVLKYTESLTEIVTYLILVALAACIFFTIKYIYHEISNRDKISIPKNIYVVSILLLYSVFFYDLIIGYIVFAFSHALEYIAFVNFYVDSKYKKKDPPSKSILGKASKKLWLYSGLFSIGIVLLCLLGRGLDKEAFKIYIVGSSFLHFIYDGMIWKVRRPDVGKPLEIKYS